jgi:hypothetical protein
MVRSTHLVSRGAPLGAKVFFLVAVATVPLLAQGGAQIATAASPGVHPIAGSGSGGAFGPRVVSSLTQLPGGNPQTASTAQLPPPRRGAASSASPQLPVWTVPVWTVPVWTVQVSSSDASTTDAALGTQAPSTTSNPTRLPSSNFTAPWMIDVAGTSDGSRILMPASNGQVAIYSLSGSLLKSTASGTFWCGGSNPLPICSSGGFDADDRALYDPDASRWIITGMQVFCTGCIATSLLAVSQTADPTLGWYLYQFPQCGSFDTWDTGDQPHTGFSSQWIVVTGTCSASSDGINGAGLAVFDKAQLYAGASLVLNQNWFEFVDPWAGGPYSGIGGGFCTRDNPVATYTATINNRAYLDVSDFSCVAGATRAPVIYSDIEGPTDAPVYFPSVMTVTPSFVVSSAPSEFDARAGQALDAPGCTGCMGSDDNTWIHSSGVWAFSNGVPYILSTMVLGDPRYQRGTQLISIALNTQTGTATAMQLSGGHNGAGPLAAEIAMPLVGTKNSNKALIVYDYTDSSFYPGVKSATWDIDHNSVRKGSVTKEGSLTPPAGSFTAYRWNDFLDALVPIPGSSSLVLGATLAVPGVNGSDAVTYWATAQP